MKLTSFLLVLMVAGALPGFGAGEPALNLMPMPRKLERGSGALRIDGKFQVAFARAASPLLQRAASRMIAQLGRETGIPIGVKNPAAIGSASTLVIDCKNPADKPDTLGADESYTLDVDASHAKLTAPGSNGVLRGLQTFLQLVAAGGDSFIAPAVHIEDSPRFAWRGLLIDVTSHFMPVSVIERNMDAMEAVKLNVFHWHLTDDQGFRVESKVFPKLHKLGSDGDYYSYEDIHRVLAYAHDRGIRVVPEFDMPGHCATWLIGYPELASGPGPYSIIHTFGVYDPALDPTREAVYQFVDKLLGEMTALFPDEYLHIGGDEVNGKAWKANPAIQKYIQDHGLKDEAGLQAYFNQRVGKLIRKHGKKMMGWDEVLHPDLPRDFLVQSWRDAESMAVASKRGYRTLLSFGYYLDHLDTSRTYYGVDPLGGPAKDLTAEEAGRVLGGEACMWTEFVNPETIDSRIWPKTAAIAERLWSLADVKDPVSMYQRLDVISHRLDWRGVEHNRNYEDMLARLAEGRATDQLRILADALQPLGIDGRETAQRYSQETQLNRLVDVARGESVTARQLEFRIAEWHKGQDDSAIREVLLGWRDQQKKLQPVLESSFLLKDAAAVSAGLSRAGVIGLEALGYLQTGKRPSQDWAKRSLAELDELEKPKAETTLAAVAPVRALVRSVAK